MKGLKLLFAVLSAMFFGSCQKQEGSETASNVAVRLNMSMSDYSELVYVQSNRPWTGKEKVLLIDPSQDNVKVTSEPISTNNLNALFIYNMPLQKQQNTLVGIYPHTAAVNVRSDALVFNIPECQNGNILNLMAGKTNYQKGSYQGGAIALKPLYRILNVWVDRSNHIISKVKVTGKNGEPISGEVTLDISAWNSQAMSSSVTVNLNTPLDCSGSRQSIPVMVADTGCKDFIAEITTVEGETFTTENIVEGFVTEEDKTYELGVSQALFASLSAAEAKSMPDSGVKYLEVTMNTFWRNYTEEECYTRARNNKKVIEATPGLEVWSVHLPFSGTLDISVLDDKKRAENVAIQTEMIRLAGEFKPKKLVLHPSSEPISENDRAARIRCAKESIRLLLPIAKEIGAELCIENLPRTCLGRNSEEIKLLIEDFPEVMVCFDTNHLLTEDHNMFFKNVGDRITTLHVSDYDKVDERHWLPGRGVIDWPQFMTNLMHYGYDGVFMTEIKSVSLTEVINAYKTVICATK